MPRKFFDDFVRKSIKDMSESISDMTYSYKETIVPAKHYQELLSKSIDELVAQDINIELNLLEPYFKIISDLKKENPKFFFKALVLSEAGIKPSAIQAVEVDALNYVWNCYDSSKPKDKKLLSDKILDDFTDVCKNGLSETEKIEATDPDGEC